MRSRLKGMWIKYLWYWKRQRSIPQNTHPSITGVLHARVLGRAAVPAGYLEILGKRASFSPIRVSPGSIPRTSLAAAKSKVHRTHPVYRYCRHALMNEPFVSWQSCGRYCPEPTPPAFYSAADHDFRNILIRTQVRLKDATATTNYAAAREFFPAALRRAGFNRLVRHLIGPRWFIINSSFKMSLFFFSEQTSSCDNLDWRFITRVSHEDDLRESVILSVFCGSAW